MLGIMGNRLENSRNILRILRNRFGIVGKMLGILDNRLENSRNILRISKNRFGINSENVGNYG